MMARESRLKLALDEVKDQYDYVLIDCPPSLGHLTINAFTASDSILIPVQCEYYALEGLSQLLNTIRLVQKHFNPELRIEGVLSTMYDARTNLGSEVVRKCVSILENECMIRLFHAMFDCRKHRVMVCQLLTMIPVQEGPKFTCH